MNRLLLLIFMGIVSIASYAHYPSPLAHQANIDSSLIFGDKLTFDTHIKKYGQLAAKANNKEDACRYGGLQAEFHCFAGEPEASLQKYKETIDSFTDEVSGYTKVSIICSALQTSIDYGLIDEALPYSDEMIRIYGEIGATCDDNGYLADYVQLTLALISQYIYDRDALKTGEEVAETYKTKYGATSPQYALGSRILGNMYSAFDLRSQASTSYSTALDIWGEKQISVDKFSVFLGLAALTCEMSDFQSARQYLDNAGEVLAALGLQRTYYGLALSEMKCTFFVVSNAWNETLEECEKGEKLSEELYGPNHLTAQRLQACKAAALINIKDDRRNRADDIVKAIEIFDPLLDDQRFIGSRICNDYLVALSVWSSIIGVFAPDQVISMYKKVCDDLFLVCPRKHSVTYNFYESWALAHLLKSDFKNAADKYRKSFESSRESLHASLSFLTEKDRAQLIKDIYHYQDNVFGLGKAPTGEKNVAPILFDNAMFIKSIMMQSVASLKHQVEMLPKTETEAHELLANFQSLKKKRLHGEYVSDKEFNVAEQKLLKYLEQHPEHGDYLSFIFNDWTHVAEKLGDRDAVVEFIASEKTWDHNRVFAAEVLCKGKKPQHVKLFTINDKDKHLLSTDKGQFNQFVCDSVWSSELLSYLPKGGNIYFVPIEELYGMALEYIPVGKDHIPMSDMYNMVRLSSSRELLGDFNDRSLSSECTATIYGGLNYNTSVEDMELYALEANERGKRGNTLWQMLPGTRREAENVAGALTAYNPRLITGDEGIEESFKALDGSRTSLIHIATHGFYNAGETNDPETALDRTGLIMSGANNYWLTQQAPMGIDDGVLTAREIADLDLRGTDMVVLSACQTGLGDVSGEGVYGLQRAFKMAGAQSILMSLWPVNDEATQILMTEFYRNLAAGHTKRSALREARRSLAASTFNVGGIEYQGSDPQFSAAFVLLD